MGIQLDLIKVIAIDLDGVVYEGKDLIDGVALALNRLRKMNFRIGFLTNNSTRSSHEIKEKLQSMKIDDFPYEVINSIDSVIELLHRLNVGETERIFVIGAESLKKEISTAGFTIINNPDCDYLIVGFDPEFNLNTVGLGLEALESHAKFIVCNREPNYPGENGHLKPGCGAIVAAIEASANCHPEYVAGKPSTIMLDILCARFHCTPQEVLVIGDSLDSDISMANQYGVYSGWVSRGKDFAQDSSKPSFVINNLSELPDKLISINGEQ